MQIKIHIAHKLPSKLSLPLYKYKFPHLIYKYTSSIENNYVNLSPNVPRKPIPHPPHPNPPTSSSTPTKLNNNMYYVPKSSNLSVIIM